MGNGPFENGPYGKRPLWETAILGTASMGMAILGTAFMARNHLTQPIGYMITLHKSKKSDCHAHAVIRIHNA